MRRDRGAGVLGRVTRKMLNKPLAKPTTVGTSL